MQGIHQRIGASPRPEATAFSFAQVTIKADKTEQIYQQEADERKAQKRVREAVQKENSEAAGKAHESYVIQPGDTLFQISMDRYGSIEAISQICKLNGMSADEIIYPGQVIVLP